MKYPAERDLGGAVAVVVLVAAFAGFGLYVIVSEGAIGGGILALLPACDAGASVAYYDLRRQPVTAPSDLRLRCSGNELRTLESDLRE